MISAALRLTSPRRTTTVVMAALEEKMLSSSSSSSNNSSVWCGAVLLKSWLVGGASGFRKSRAHEPTLGSPGLSSPFVAGFYSAI